jgi:hypothetical protein
MSIHRKGCNCNCKSKKSFDSKFSTKRKSIKKVTNPFTKIQLYAKSLASRRFSNKRTDKATKQLRYLSCFGDASIGGQLKPCEELQDSKTEGKFYCGACGCGDRKATWLEAESDHYSKLDYPVLSCPLKMPGFSDYDGSDSKQNIRKNIIENYDLNKLVQIQVSVKDTEQI